jgi:hypothetical protein
MTAKTPATQLEIAAHWLDEAGRHFADLRQFDQAENCKRVAKDCAAMAKREGGK